MTPGPGTDTTAWWWHTPTPPTTRPRWPAWQITTDHRGRAHVTLDGHPVPRLGAITVEIRPDAPPTAHLTVVGVHAEMGARW